MAIRRRNVLGPVSGKLDNIIIRQRYGKEVIYHKPDSYDISYSKEAVEGRNKFGKTVKLARLLNSNAGISLIWKQSKCKGTNAYQKIIKHNLALTSAEGITKANVITPTGLFVSQQELSFINNRVAVKIKIEENTAGLFSKIYSLFSFMNTSRENLFLTESTSINIDENIFSCEIKIDNEISKLLNNSSKTILICGLSFVSPEDKIIYWSSSFSFIIDNSRQAN